MFDHVTIRVSDRGASERFYDTVLGAIGIERTATDEWDDLSFVAASAEQPVTRGLHIGFGAEVHPRRRQVLARGRGGGLRE